MKRLFTAFISAMLISSSYAQNVGINVANPLIKVDVSLNSVIGTSATSIDQHDPSNQGTKVSFGAVSTNALTDFAGMRTIVIPGQAFCGNAGEVSFYTWACNISGSREIMRINGQGRVGIMTTVPYSALSVNGNADFANEVCIGALQANTSAALDVNSTTRGFLPPRMTATQRDAIASPATGLTIYNTTINGVQVYNGSIWYSSQHFVGESYGGGIVFYVYDNGQHGLIAAPADQNGGATIRWFGGTNTNTRARANGVGAGLKNTMLIIANQATIDVNPFAAAVCNEYTATISGVTYGDWYMPSQHELNLLYLQKNVVGGFANAIYWTSQEVDAGSAYFQNFTDGGQSINPKNTLMRIRAIRAF